MSIGKFLESLSQAILAGRFLVGRLGVGSVLDARSAKEWLQIGKVLYEGKVSAAEELRMG